jgi:hypothetical protein
LSSKYKKKPKILVVILVIIAVNLWSFPLHSQTREKERKEKPKKGFLDHIRRINKIEKDNRKIPPQIKKKPEIETNKKKFPAQIKQTPKTETNKKKIPGEIKKATKTEKVKKKIPDEIIMISKLDEAAKKFSISRDIFSPDLMKPVDPGSGRKPITPPPPPLPVEKKDLPIVDPKAQIEEEIQGLSYEGYVIKNSKNCALVSMNGEFHAVTVGDIILEKIKILKIDREAIKVEVDSHEFEIQIKEDEANEIQ